MSTSFLWRLNMQILLIYYSFLTLNTNRLNCGYFFLSWFILSKHLFSFIKELIWPAERKGVYLYVVSLFYIYNIVLFSYSPYTHNYLLNTAIKTLQKSRTNAFCFIFGVYRFSTLCELYVNQLCKIYYDELFHSHTNEDLVQRKEKKAKPALINFRT